MAYIMYLRNPNMFRYTGITKYTFRMVSSSVMDINKNNTVTKKMTELITWYEQITGMDEVRKSQKRVLEQEQKLAYSQEHRREVNKLVNAVQTKLRELHAELDSTPRGEDRYINLITQEHSLLKEERRLATELQQYEREERDYFTALSSAVKESHEKERAQAERTKYWSIIGSIVGTVIGIAGSSVNNHFKMKKFEMVVKESVGGVQMNSGNIPQFLQKQQEQLNQIVSQIKDLSVLPSSKSSIGVSAERMLKLVVEHQIEIHNRINEMQTLFKQVLGDAIKDVTKHKQDSVSVDREKFIKPPDVPFIQDNIEAVVGVVAIVFGVVILCCCCCR